MDVNAVIKNYSRIYRWLGLCIDFYSDLDEEDDDREYADRMRKNPAEVLDALVQIRMALITFNIASVGGGGEHDHFVKHSDLDALMHEYPPQRQQIWWPVWKRFLDTIDDNEWSAMWIEVDATIEAMLKVHAKAGPKI